MKRHHVVLLFAVLLGALAVAGSKSDGLTVHEWGTFTSVAGENGESLDWNGLGGKRDLPQFVQDGGYRCTKWGFQGNVRMETPVIYFYSPREVTAQVSVKFPHGVITEWYPSANTEIYQSKHALDEAIEKLPPSRQGIDTSLRTVLGSIEWHDVKVQPSASANFPDDHHANRYYAARQTDGDHVTVGNQHEKFLFYRGVARLQVPLNARISEGKVLLSNHGSAPVASAILFQNRDGRIRYSTLGAIRTTATADPATVSGSMPQLLRELEDALVSQGLFRKEAHAMVETWHDSWFEEGTRIIYIVPSGLIDSALPLRVDPAPSQVTRVFVGRIELLTAETQQAVQQGLEHGDNSIVERYGRFLGPLLDRVVASRPALAPKAQQIRGKMMQQSCQ